MKLLQLFKHLAAVFDQQRFCDLNFEVFGLQFNLLQYCRNLLDQVTVLETQGRHIHRDGDHGAPLRVPGLQLAACGFQNPTVNAGNQTVRLGKANELVWADQPARRMLPAHQRLQPHDVTIRVLALGLVVNHELLVNQRRLELALFVLRLVGLLEHGRLEQLVVGAATLFGLVHRSVGMAHQLVGGLAVCRKNADADGRRD